MRSLKPDLAEKYWNVRPATQTNLVSAVESNRPVRVELKPATLSVQICCAITWRRLLGRCAVQ